MLVSQICCEEPNLTLLNPAFLLSHFRVSDPKQNDAYINEKFRSKINSLQLIKLRNCVADKVDQQPFSTPTACYVKNLRVLEFPLQPPDLEGVGLTMSSLMLLGEWKSKKIHNIYRSLNCLNIIQTSWHQLLKYYLGNPQLSFSKLRAIPKKCSGYPQPETES